MTGFAPGSAYKVPSTSKSLTKSAAGNLDTSDPMVIKSVAPSSGFTVLPMLEPAELTSADFYRHGGGEVGNSAGTLARVIDPFEYDDKEASIRVYGILPGGQREGDLMPAYTKFILEGTNEAEMERMQTSQTFGDAYYFFYGKSPTIYNYSATLINSKNVNWVSDFMFYYENYLRGTRCAESRAKVVLTYGGRQVEGFMINCSMQTQAVVENGVKLSFQVAITGRKYLGFSADFGMAVDADGTRVVDEATRHFLDSIAGKEGNGLSSSATSDAYNATKDVMSGSTPAVAPSHAPGGFIPV